MPIFLLQPNSALLGIIYRNLTAGDIIQVVEMGGRDTFGEYSKHCFTDEKDFETLTYPDSYKVVCGADGFWPMKEGEQVLLFLGDTTGFLKEVDGTLYDIIGDYDGKLYLQSDGTYSRPSPSETDEYVFEAENLTTKAYRTRKGSRIGSLLSTKRFFLDLPYMPFVRCHPLAYAAGRLNHRITVLCWHSGKSNRPQLA